MATHKNMKNEEGRYALNANLPSFHCDVIQKDIIYFSSVSFFSATVKL